MENRIFERPLKTNGSHDIEIAYQTVFTMFRQFVPNIPEVTFNRFKESSMPLHFKRYDIILDYGQICKHAYLMFSGVVRLNRILKSRGETAIWFLSAGDIVIAPDSFYTQTLSSEQLTALTDAFCIVLPITEIQAMCLEFPDFHLLVRLLTERYYLQALERATWFYESPQIRYENMLRDYPDVVEHVSVKELASYIAIAPETLSRIRNRISSSRRKH